MMTLQNLRIMIVDDNRVIRDGLTIFLKIFEDLEFVGDASNGVEAIARCEELKPDIILMDIMMPCMNGIQATQEIKTKYPEVKIIGLTSFSSDEAHITAMLDAGAVACLPKQASIDEIVRNIRGD